MENNPVYSLCSAKKDMVKIFSYVLQIIMEVEITYDEFDDDEALSIGAYIIENFTRDNQFNADAVSHIMDNLTPETEIRFNEAWSHLDRLIESGARAAAKLIIETNMDLTIWPFWSAKHERLLDHFRLDECCYADFLELDLSDS